MADIFPTSHLVPWTRGTTVGVQGGIVTGRTVVNVTGLDTAGVGDCYAAIQAAIDAAAPGTQVTLPAGLLRVNNTLIINASRPGITLAGQGASTIIDSRGALGILVGQGSGVIIPGGANASDMAVTAGLTRDSQSITVGNASFFTAGQLVLLEIADDRSTLPVFNVAGDDWNRRQLLKVATASGTTVTFSPPLYENYGAVAGRLRVMSGGFGSLVGIENLTLDLTNGAGQETGIQFMQCINCWAKNVRVQGMANRAIWCDMGLFLEVRKCYLDERKGELLQPNGAGFLVQFVSGSLYEDNIVLGNFPDIEVNHGASGNLFSGNYCNGTFIDTNHGAWNQFNMYRNNRCGGFLSDGYFGGCRYDKIFNNKTGFIALKRLTYDYGIVGNFMTEDPADMQLGYPNMSNNEHLLPGVNFPTTKWGDWNMLGTLTSRVDGSNGEVTFNSGTLRGPIGGDFMYITLWWNSHTVGQRYRVGSVVGNVATVLPDQDGVPNVIPLPDQGSDLAIYPRQYGFQELDLKVETSLIRKGNRYGNGAFEALAGGDTINAALPQSVKPQYVLDGEAEFSTTFPLNPFDAVNLTAASDSDIPAGYRYLFATPPAHESASVNSAGTELSVTMNKPIAIGSGGNGGFTMTGGITLEFARIVGSTIVYTLSRVATDEETFSVTYAQPGDGVVDSNDNELGSFLNLAVQNFSNQSAGAVWVQRVAIEDTNSESLLNNFAAIKQAVDITVAGLVTRIRVGIGAQNNFESGSKVALLDAAGTVLAQASGPVEVTNDYAVYPIAAVHVTPGTYYVAVIADSNGDPSLRYLGSQPANSSSYSYANSGYAAWPGATVPSDGFQNWSFAMGVRLAPDVAGSAPDAPSGLTAVAAGVGQINLAWTDNSDNETGFKILRGPTSGSLSLVHTVGPGVTSYSNTGLANGTRYFFAVRATNNDGDSANSNVADDTTPTVSPGSGGTKLRSGRNNRFGVTQ